MKILIFILKKNPTIDINRPAPIFQRMSFLNEAIYSHRDYLNDKKFKDHIKKGAIKL